LQDGLRLVLLDSLGHHIENVVHDSCSKFEIEVRFDTLFRNRLCNSLRVTTFELTSEQVTEPSLEERNDTTEEEEPNSPSRRPETDTRTFTDGTSVEASVDDVLQILAHSDLPHQLVLVSVHTSQLTNVSESELKTIGKLESIDVS